LAPSNHRRTFLKKFTLLSALPLLSYAQQKPEHTNIHIKMKGPLDDDLFVFKASPHQTDVISIQQMHNPKGKFLYNNQLFNSSHIPGYIDYDKHLTVERNEILIVMTANERDELYNSPFETKVLRKRTHYKSVNLYCNDKILLPALMPEYNSVKNYPLWFKEGEAGEEGNTIYNYYKLWENAIVQIGLVFNSKSRAKIECFDKNAKKIYTYNFTPNTIPKQALSEEAKKGELNIHPFTEVDNVLNDQEDLEYANNNYIDYMIIYQNNNQYLIEMPYPFMYPNQIYTGLSNNA